MNRTKIVEQCHPMDTANHHTSSSHGNDASEGSSAKILRRMLSGEKTPETNSRRYLIAGGNASSTMTDHFDLDKFVCSSSSPSPVMTTELWPHINTTTEHDYMASSEPASIFTTSYNSSPSSAFLPLDSNVSISNGQVMRYNQSLDLTENQNLLSDVSMDTTLSQTSESYDLDNLSIYTTAQHTVISSQSLLSTNQNLFHTSGDQPKSLKQEIYNSEDSLTGMLNTSIDLMDVGSLMTFLEQDQVPTMSTQSQRVPSS